MTESHRPFWLANARLGPGASSNSAVLIRSGLVAAVADSPAPGDDVVDVDGCTLLPGLWDAHVHLEQWASARRRVDLSAAGSAVEAADLMSAAAKAVADSSGLLVGFGFRDGLWADRPDAGVLAARGPATPMALISGDLHSVWLNRPALSLVGIADHPTGLLREEEGWAVMDRLNNRGPSEVDQWVLEAMAAAAARGVVGLIDFEDGNPLEAWPRRGASGDLPTRVVAAVYPRYLDQVIAANLRSGATLEGSAGLAEIGPLKLFLDGSLNTRTALCYQAYSGGGEAGHGQARTELPEAVDLMGKAAGHGILPSLHAIGDRANTTALDAFEQVGCGGRIEHAQLVDWDDLPRFSRAGLILGVQPSHAIDDRDVAERYWENRTDRAFPYASLLGAGATLEFGSDAPVSPLDPWWGISAAVFRTDGERPPWHREQRIGLAAALAAACRGRRGIGIGMVADLVAVGSDPGVLDAAGLRAMPVAATIVGGRFTHRDI